ncbi:MAG TPA: DUF3007 family protein [Oscillatoriaceae cyanobacterium M33_DOE_052]|uniref:DUF3007 family protein n=1 Tax=Planktothricoides sp. SpSt-374 TaxID=2282167 RepID=A0A7C3VJM8_9CYAN|nr:DUF3007 family protein [Oscillatoriaceae cyanobacterium M33_DOE_052]
MRRIDAIAISLGMFLAGGIAYFAFTTAGLDTATAGIWSQAILVGGLVGWLLSYLFRAVSGKMTYHQQLQDYENAVLQKRLDSLTPEELAQLEAEIAQEQQSLSVGESPTTGQEK